RRPAGRGAGHQRRGGAAPPVGHPRQRPGRRCRRRDPRLLHRDRPVTGRPRGPFPPGDPGQLTHPHGPQPPGLPEPGRSFHTRRGAIAHDDLIGAPEGSVVTASSGTAYLALRPLLADYVLAMPRGAQVVYPKDAALIVTMGDVFPGACVLEA